MSSNLNSAVGLEGARVHRTWHPSSNVKVWLALVAYLVVAKLLLSVLPPLNVREVQSDFAWANIIAFGFLGLVGVLLADRSGFPQALDSRISQRQRFLIPILAGIGLAVLAVAIDLWTGGAKFIELQTGQKAWNVAFPLSLLTYTGGVVEIEAFYRLLPIPLLLWIISSLILRGRSQERVFWVLAIILSLLEPVLQGLGILFLKSSDNTAWLFLTLFLPYFLTNYPLNLGQAFLLRRYGLLASAAMRFGFYLMWHIIYGSLIYPAIFH